MLFCYEEITMQKCVYKIKLYYHYLEDSSAW